MVPAAFQHQQRPVQQHGGSETSQAGERPDGEKRHLQPIKHEPECSTSSSDWEDERWDSLEQQALNALDAQLDMHYPVGCDIPCKSSVTGRGTGSGAGQDNRQFVDHRVFYASSSESNQQQQARSTDFALAARKPSSPNPNKDAELLKDACQLQEICLQERYQPEDHVLTAEEMWGGTSSSDDQGEQETQLQLEKEDPARKELQLHNAGELNSRHQLISRGAAPAVWFGHDSLNADRWARNSGLPRSERNPEAETEEGNHSELASVAARLQAVCQEDPYCPEDHLLTPDEMWGGILDDDVLAHAGPSASASPSTNDSQGPRGCTLEVGSSCSTGSCQPCQSPPMARRPAEFGAGPFRDQGLPPGFGGSQAKRVGGHALPNGNAPQDAVAAAGVLCVEERLRRLLSGPGAAEALKALGFSELSAVAADCQLAVETFRWVLARQQELLATGAALEDCS